MRQLQVAYNVEIEGDTTSKDSRMNYDTVSHSVYDLSMKYQSIAQYSNCK